MDSVAHVASAQEQAPSSDEQAASLEELEKKLENPISDLIRIPFQNNIDFDIGPFHRTANVLNLQPVIPLHVTEDWAVVSRSILPIVWSPKATQENGETFGMGDLTETLFVTPSKPHCVIVGFGPAFIFPTATSSMLGSFKWSLGPAAAVLMQPPGPLTFGAIAWQTWSIIGPSDQPSVSALVLQPFIVYDLPLGFYLVTMPRISANWKAGPANNIWTVPVGGGGGKIVRVDGVPVNLQVQAFYNVARPRANPVPSDVADETDLDTPGVGGPTWQLRFQLVLLFPAK